MAGILDYLMFGTGGPKTAQDILGGFVPGYTPLNILAGGNLGQEAGRGVQGVINPAIEDFRNRYGAANFDQRFGFPNPDAAAPATSSPAGLPASLLSPAPMMPQGAGVSPPVATAAPPMQTTPASLDTGGGPRYSGQSVTPQQAVAPPDISVPAPTLNPFTRFAMGMANPGSTYALQQQQQNQVATTKAIYQGLMSRGDYHPEEAMAIAQAAGGDKEVAKALLPQMFGRQQPAGVVKIAGNEIPFFMKQGKPQYIIPGEEGGMVGLQGLLDFANKQTAAKAGAEATGKSQAEAAQELPAAQDNVKAMMGEVQALKTHKELAAVTGPIAGHLPGRTGDQNDVIKRLEQLKGALSQAGLQSMRNSGIRITQTEAQWFGAAMGRLDRTVGKDNLENALGDIEDKLSTIYKNNQIKAGFTPQEMPAAAKAPKPGTYKWSPAGGLIQQ